MPDLIIYPYGKPVPVKWENDAVPPTPEEVDFIVADYKKRFPGGVATSAGTNTGRVGQNLARLPAMPGSLPVQGGIGDSGFAPVNPMGGFGVQDQNTKQAVNPAQIEHDRNIALLTQAAARGDLVAQTKLLQLQGAKPQTTVSQVAQRLQAPIIPQPQAPAPKPVDIRRNPVRDTIQTAAKEITAKTKNQPLNRGEFTDPTNGNPIPWIQTGVGYEATVDGQRIKAASPKLLIQKIIQTRQQTKNNQEAAAMSPNVAAYTETNDKLAPPDVHRLGNQNRLSAEYLIQEYGKLTPDQRDVENRRLAAYGKGAEVLGKVASVLHGDLRPLVGVEQDAVSKTISELAPGMLAQSASTLDNLTRIGNPNYTTEEQAGAAANFLVLALTSEFVPGTGSVVDKAFGLLSKPKGKAFEDALAKLEAKVGPAAAAKVEQFVKDNPGLTFKGLTPEGKPKFSVKADVEIPKPEPPPKPEIQVPAKGSEKSGPSLLKGKDTVHGVDVKRSPVQIGTKLATKNPDNSVTVYPKFFEQPEGVQRSTLFHELAHGVEDKYSLDKDWDSIYRSEAGDAGAPGVTKLDGVGLSNRGDEALLRGIEWFLDNPKHLKEKFPKTYEFIKSRVIPENPEIADTYARVVGKAIPERGANGSIVARGQSEGGVLDAGRGPNTGNPPPPTSPKVDAPKVEPKKPLEDLKTGDGATGLANQVNARERAAGKLGEEVDVKGMSKEAMHQKGKELYNTPGYDIEDTIGRLVKEKRPANGVEYGAALEHKRMLIQRVEKVREKLDTAIGAGEAVGKLQDDLKNAEKAINDWSNLVDETKTYWSDSGRGLQIGTTVNEGNLTEVLLERRRKLGRDLTKREKQLLEEQVNKFHIELNKAGVKYDPAGTKTLDEALQEWRQSTTKVDRAKAEEFLRQPARRPRTARTVEGARTARKEAASRILATIAKSGSQMGAGPGQAFSALREAVPEIVDDVKIIIKSIADEFAIKVLDKRLFDAVRKELPGVDISDDDIIKTLAGHWDDKVARTETAYASLTKQARKLELEPIRAEKARLRADERAAHQAVMQEEAKLALANRQAKEAAARAQAQANQIEDDAIRSLREANQKKADQAIKDSNERLAKAKRAVKKIEDRLDTLDDLEEQISQKGFWESQKRVKKATKEQQMLDLTIGAKRRQIQGLIRERDMGAFERASRGIGNVFRSTKLGYDMGMVLRQGLFTLGRGKATLKGIENLFKALPSEDAWAAIDHAYFLKETKDGRLLEPIRRAAGLSTSDVFLNPEELTVLQKLKSIPGLGKLAGALERGQSAFINTVRREAFDHYVEFAKDVSEKELKARARFINAATGRSNIKSVPAMLEALMTSPRYTASRWEMIGEMARNPFAAFKSEAARENLKDLGATAALVLGSLKVAELAGFQVEWDPYSNDFMKIRRGDQTYDPTAGMGKVVRTAARMIGYTAGFKEMTARENWGKEFGKIFSDTVSPAITVPIALRTGKSITGYDLDDEEKGVWAAAPLILSGFAQTMTAEGAGQALIDTLPEFFGVGTNRYGSSKVDAVGRPWDATQERKDMDVISELNRLGVKIDKADKRGKDEPKETDTQFKARAIAQGNAVLNALRELMRSPSYKGMSLREKQDEAKKAASAAKKEFNADFNDQQRTRKEDERLKEIERQLAGGIR